MRVIYDAQNVVDAHLVKHALEAEGIPVFVRGEYLTGALGDLPMQGLVQVCVPDSAWEAAQACMAGIDLSFEPLDEDADPAGDGLLA